MLKQVINTIRMLAMILASPYIDLFCWLRVKYSKDDRPRRLIKWANDQGYKVIFGWSSSFVHCNKKTIILDSAFNNDEIVCVLAHECGHVIQIKKEHDIIPGYIGNLSMRRVFSELGAWTEGRDLIKQLDIDPPKIWDAMLDISVHSYFSWHNKSSEFKFSFKKK